MKTFFAAYLSDALSRSRVADPERDCPDPDLTLKKVGKGFNLRERNVSGSDLIKFTLYFVILIFNHQICRKIAIIYPFSMILIECTFGKILYQVLRTKTGYRSATVLFRNRMSNSTDVISY